MTLDDETRQKLGALLAEKRNLLRREEEEIDEFLSWLGKSFQETSTVNEEIERKKPLEVKYSEQDFDGLKWSTKTGTKAEYQQTTKEANQNSEVFQALQQILREKNGFWQSSSHKYWTHRGDENTVDRRRT